VSRTDPRPAAIATRLKDVRRVLAVTGGKGGIGKSLVSSTLAAELARQGRTVGLLDLDLTGPSDHVFLGLDDRFPTEEFGIDPPELHGVRFMSIAYFVGDHPAPLRGVDVTNALIELLAITNWRELDLLVIDMPPGLGDATLDAVRLLSRAEFLFVATASRVVLETVRRTLRFHRGLDSNVAGVLHNMDRGDPQSVRELATAFDAPWLDSLPFDKSVETAVGDMPALLKTPFGVALRGVVTALES
jgi:ATP-binding protein involved in chromosome partitioning